MIFLKEICRGWPMRQPETIGRSWTTDTTGHRRSKPPLCGFPGGTHDEPTNTPALDWRHGAQLPPHSERQHWDDSRSTRAGYPSSYQYDGRRHDLCSQYRGASRLRHPRAGSPTPAGDAGPRCRDAPVSRGPDRRSARGAGAGTGGVRPNGDGVGLQVLRHVRRVASTQYRRADSTWASAIYERGCQPVGPARFATTSAVTPGEGGSQDRQARFAEAANGPDHAGGPLLPPAPSPAGDLRRP